MMSDPVIPEPEMSEPAADNSRRWLLISLGAVALFAVGIALGTAAKRKAPPLDVAPDENAPAPAWASSLKHLAEAWEIRYAGIEDELARLRGVGGNGDGGFFAPVVSGDAEPGPPPAPAAISVPPSEDVDVEAEA